jgi:hypothetical protein
LIYLQNQVFCCFLFQVPIDLPITKREHFNGWYKPSAYYLALLISDVPIILLCVSLYVSLIYTLTDQPLEAFRFFNFLSIGFCACFTAQAYGMLMGSFFEMKVSFYFKQNYVVLGCSKITSAELGNRDLLLIHFSYFKYDSFHSVYSPLFFFKV